MPEASVSFRLLRTYTCDAGFSPTSTTASPGTLLPAAMRAATCCATSAVTRSASALPSMIRAVMVRSLPDRARYNERVIAEPLLAAVHARLAAALAAPTGDYVPLRIGSHVIG